MELFPTTENVVRFDATSDFLKRFCSFGLLFAEMGFGSIINMIKLSHQIGDKRYVSNGSLYFRYQLVRLLHTRFWFH